MSQNEFNLNPIITIADKYEIRLPSDRRFADIQDDFAFPSTCPKEKLARKMYSQLTALEELSHIDGVPARCMMITIPHLRSKEQRDFTANILNKPIFLHDGSINVHSATVSVSLKSAILFIEFRGVGALDTFFGGLVIQIVNDSIQAIMSKFTSYTIDETQDNVLGVVGTIGSFDSVGTGVETYEIIYDMNQIITLIYLDKTRYRSKIDFLKIATHLVQNSLNRYIMFRGKPCSCIIVNDAQVIHGRFSDLFDSLEKWERCLGYMVARSTEDIELQSGESGTIERRILSRDERPDRSELLDVFLLTRRGTKYQFDAAVDLKKRISRILEINTEILDGTPSCPQDLLTFQLRVSNMSTFSCVKSIEAILKEQGSYEIEIDLASGIVQYLNTEESIQRIMQSIRDAGFGVTQVLKSEQTDLANELDAAVTNEEYIKHWIFHMATIASAFVIMNVAKLIAPLSYQVTLANNIVSIILSLMNYHIVISGVVTAIRGGRWRPETSFAIVVILQFIFSIGTLALMLVHLDNSTVLTEVSAVDVSDGTTAVLFIVCLARMIESYGKRNAIKQFEGLAETLPSDIYVVRNLMLEKLVEQFGEDQQTVEFLESTQLQTREDADGNNEELPAIPDCIPRSESFSIAYTDVLKSSSNEGDLNSLINSDILEKILTTLSLKHYSFDIDSYNNNELAQQHKIQTVKLASLAVGQVVLVYPGEIIPCDGYILHGHSPIDESIVSMRHHGIAKGPGDKVYAGTRVLSGDVFVCACAIGQDTLLGHLISSVRRSTIAANSIVEQRDDLETMLMHGKRDLHRFINNTMFWYRPIILLLSCIATILFSLDFFVFHAIKVDLLFPTQLTHSVSKLCGKLSALLTVFSCLELSSEPFAFQLCLPLCSLVGTDRFAKQAIIVRDCAKVCQKLNEVKVVAFPRSGGLTYGKPLITELHMYIDIMQLIESIPTEYDFQGDGSAHISYGNLKFESKETFAQYLQQIDNFNDLLRRPDFRQEIINECIELLKYISSIMVAHQNSIQAGVFTTIRTLEEQKYTKYLSKPSIVMRQSMPIISSFEYDSQQNILQGEIVQQERVIGLKIQQVFDEMERSENNRICISFSELVEEQIRVSAVSTVDDDHSTNNDRFHLLVDNIHSMDFLISDKLREEAPGVIRQLESLGYATFLTSTDSTDSCAISAERSGIPARNVYSNLEFDEKPHILTKLAAKHGKILYVCDGVNDLKCIQSVHVSLAVSDGRDGIKAASDFVSLKCTLSDVVKCLEMAKAIRAELVTSQLIACVFTIVLIPFSAGVLLPAGKQVYVQYIAICTAVIGIIVLIICLSFLKKVGAEANADESVRNSEEIEVARETA